MRALVDNDEIEKVRKSLETTPTVIQAFGMDWINNNLLKKEKRSEKHVMFWMLLSEERCNQMEEWLMTLRTKLPIEKFNKIVNLLKEKKQKKQFYSFVSEIEVLSYYKKQENDDFKVEFEPDIPGKAKVGDIKLSFDSVQVFLEITRLFSSKKEEEIDRINHTIGEKIDALEGNPFIITFGTHEKLSDQDVKPFIELIQEKIDELQKNLESFQGPAKFDYGQKAWFKFYKNPKIKAGYLGGIISATIGLNSAARLKNKLLGKYEQLPENQFNVIALDISYRLADFDDVQDALEGQLGVKINPETMEAFPFRYANGIMKMEQGKKIGVVVAFKGFDYQHRRKYVNLSAERPFSDDMLSVI